jgi:hypothetical protein
MPPLGESGVATRVTLSTTPPTGSASSQTDSRGDFMRFAYELNGEPLRLLEGGQRWFRRVLAHEYSPQPNASALVLGATPWLTTIVCDTVAETAVVDTSAAMLAMCESWVRPQMFGCTHATFIRGDWLSLPDAVRGLDLVAGDNSFSFLPYPEDWDEMMDILADRMLTGSVLLARLLAIPAAHRRLRPAEIVANALSRQAVVNLTALRVALLFAHWDERDWTIRPEEALETFEKCRRDFDPVLCDAPDGTGNDLLSIEKYRGSGAIYYAPPFAETLARFERRFRVRAVYFGPFEMSQYFPLIVASKDGR